LAQVGAPVELLPLSPVAEELELVSTSGPDTDVSFALEADVVLCGSSAFVVGVTVVVSVASSPADGSPPPQPLVAITNDDTSTHRIGGA